MIFLWGGRGVGQVLNHYIVPAPSPSHFSPVYEENWPPYGGQFFLYSISYGGLFNLTPTNLLPVLFSQCTATSMPSLCVNSRRELVTSSTGCSTKELRQARRKLDRVLTSLRQVRNWELLLCKRCNPVTYKLTLKRRQARENGLLSASRQSFDQFLR